MSDEPCFTVVHAGEIRHSDARILSGDAPPGTPMTVGVGDMFAENTALRADLTAAKAERDEARDRIETLSAEITTWGHAVGSLEAHLKDRIAMNDPARPEVYLRILQAEVRDLPQGAQRVYAATQYRSQQAEAYARRENERADTALSTARQEKARADGLVAENARLRARLNGEPGDVSAEVERYVRERLAGVEVTAITTARGLGQDGDPILEVVIDCIGTPASVARSEPSGFISGMRQLLSDLGDESFPLISFRAVERAALQQIGDAATGPEEIKHGR